MGSPDLPGNDGDRRRQFQPPPSNELPMHGLDPADEQQPPADDGDGLGRQPMQEGQVDDANTASNPYTADGYHPLNFEPMAFDDDDDEDDDESEDENDEDDQVSGFRSHPVDQMSITEEDAELEVEPEEPVQRIDRDLLQQVWNQPRPAELDIAIDANKAEEIKSAMSKVSANLAGIRPPDWATVVPEGKWIEELLQKVRSTPPTE